MFIQAFSEETVQHMYSNLTATSFIWQRMHLHFCLIVNTTFTCSLLINMFTKLRSHLQSAKNMTVMSLMESVEH